MTTFHSNNLDCFWSYEYKKNQIIHHKARNGVSEYEWFNRDTWKTTPAKSEHSAKILITKHLKTKSRN